MARATCLYLAYDPNNGYKAGYVDPGADTCASLSNLYGGTTDREYRPNRGYYCGSKYDSGYSTILNKDRVGTGYLNLKYKLNDSAELYGNVLYNLSSVQYSGGPYFWETNIGGGGTFFDQNTSSRKPSSIFSLRKKSEVQRATPIRNSTAATTRGAVSVARSAATGTTTSTTRVRRPTSLTRTAGHWSAPSRTFSRSSSWVRNLEQPATVRRSTRRMSRISTKRSHRRNMRHSPASSRRSL